MPPIRGLGALLAFRKDPVAFLEALAAQGPRGEASLGGQRICLLSDPGEVGTLLIQQGTNTHKAGALSRAKPLLGEGLLTMEGEAHKARRKAVQPAFHGDRLAPLALPIVRRADALARAWSAGAADGQRVDAKEAMVGLTFGVAAECLLGEALDEELPELEAALAQVQGAFPTLVWPGAHLLLKLPLPSHLRARKGLARLHRTVDAVVARRRAAGAGGSSLLDALIRGLGEGPGAEQALRDEALSLLLAGHETTATALAWALRRVGEDPALGEAIAQEALRVAGDEGPLGLASRHAQLVFTRQVVAESLRLHPPGWLVVRKPQSDLALPLGPIQAGSLVMVSPHILHRNPLHWPDPEAFQPERHSPEASALRPRFCYLPFGAGLRGCVGEPLAWLEAVLVLACLALRLRWVAEGPRPKGQAGVTLAPAGPVWLQVKAP